MYRKTTRQVSLLDNSLWLGGSSRERLHQTWAELFCRKVLPLLLEAEDEFSDLYAAIGRPNWSVARMLGCMLLQEFGDETDQEILDNVTFDVRYQHALGLPANEAYLSRRSLVDFRSRLLQRDPEMKTVRELFDRVCAAICADLKLNTSEQRIDSTHIISNIRVRSRLGLFRQTVRHFLMWLEDRTPGELDRLSSELRAWHRDFDDSWESPRELSKHRPLILQLARWAYEIEQEFARDEAVTSHEPYQLIARLIREQCIVTDVDGDDRGDADGTKEKVTIAVHDALQKSDGAMRTPHDPDATTSKKGVGYHVQVTETCNNSGCEVITDFEVAPAHIPDTGRATDAIKRLDERGLRPEVLYADGGYPTPASLAESEELGNRLHAPVDRTSMPVTKMSRMDFVVAEQDNQIRTCPRGHAPVLHTNRAATPTRRSPFALFSADDCRPCPDLENCPVQSPGESHPNGKFRLEESRGLYLRDKTYIEQRSESWREAYRIRAGIEASMSELKRAHGIDRLRVRGRARVTLSVIFKLMSRNIKRWVRCVQDTLDGTRECIGQAA